MEYINRLDNFDGPDIAKIAASDQVRLDLVLLVQSHVLIFHLWLPLFPPFSSLSLPPWPFPLLPLTPTLPSPHPLSHCHVSYFDNSLSHSSPHTLSDPNLTLTLTSLSHPYTPSHSHSTNCTKRHLPSILNSARRVLERNSYNTMSVQWKCWWILSEILRGTSVRERESTCVCVSRQSCLRQWTFFSS